MGVIMNLLTVILTFLVLSCQSPVFAGTDQWTSNGPFGGGINSLCRSPQFSTDHTIFAGTGDGFFISADRGASWTRSNNGLPNGTVTAIAVSPNFAADRTIFIGIDMVGAFRSRDGGATWQTVNFFFWPGDIAISPQFATDRTVFLVLGYNTGFKSTDGGDTWESFPLPASTVRFSPDYANDHTLFAGTTSGGVYRSIDNGVSWQQVNTGLTSGAYVHSLAISPNYATDRTLFAGTGNGIFVTTNGGDTWSAASGTSVETVISLAVSPNFAVDRTVVAGTLHNNLYISTDGGINWNILAGSFGEMIQAQLFSPDFVSDHTLFVGSDAGFFTVVNTAGNWSASNSGLGGNHTIHLALSPAFATDQTLFAGAYRGGVHRSVDGGTSWQTMNKGLDNFDVNALQLSPLFPSDHTLVAGTAGGVFISQDGGNSWRVSNTGLTSLNVTALAVSPIFATDRTIFAGTTAGVFKSTDGGGNWAPASTGLTDLNVLAMAISPAFASDRTLLVGTYGGGIAISVNAGDNWLSKNSGLEYSPHVNSVAFSPNYAIDRELFTSTLTVYRSVDNGNSWSAANSGLTSTTFKSIAVSPNYGVDHTLLVSTGSGDFSSTDSGAHWLPLGRGYDNVAFSPNYAADLTIFTGGGQVWKYTYSTRPNFISSVITYPANNSYFSASSITVTGTASEGQGYGLQKVEVSTDNGATWQLASGTANWSYFWSPANGLYTIKVRATDNNGRVEPVATNGISVAIDRTAPTGTIVYDYNNDVYKLNANANDPGWICIEVFPNVCGQMEMLLPGSSVWQQATPTLPYGTSSLWLRDIFGNSTYISQTTQYGFSVRLGDLSLYSTILQAFNSAVSGNTIKLTATSLSENLTFGRGIALTVSGGFNNTFSSVIASTTIIGAVTVQGDNLELQNINLSGAMTISSGSANLKTVIIQN
jgi:photosystem II stability/assembly factor-like uncharacterized protein